MIDDRRTGIGAAAAAAPSPGTVARHDLSALSGVGQSGSGPERPAPGGAEPGAAGEAGLGETNAGRADPGQADTERAEPGRADTGRADSEQFEAVRPFEAAHGEPAASWWRAPLTTLALCTALALFFATSSAGVSGAFVQWYVWGLLVLPILAVDRRLPVARERLWPRLLWHVPLAILWTVIYLTISREVVTFLFGAPPTRGMVTGEFRRWMAGAFHWNLLVYAIIVGGHWALDYHRRWRERQARTTELERLLTEARLGALRDQLRPHFLFNSLNTISAYVEHEPKLARRMLGHLGDLLRWSLEEGEQQEVPLANELALLDHYLAIQRVRFQDRLTVELDVAPDTLRARVPGLLLQPLVENAIRHGLSPRAAAGRVLIVARRGNRGLHLSVQDDGVGLPAGWTLARDAGIGIGHTRRRLAALYGDAHTFHIGPAREDGRGVRVEIEVPWREGAGADEARTEEARTEEVPSGHALSAQALSGRALSGQTVRGPSPQTGQALTRQALIEEADRWQKAGR